MNTVVSTDNFLACLSKNPATFRDTILLTPVPAAGSRLEEALIACLQIGRNVFLYGPVTQASQKLRELLSLKLSEPITGDLELRTTLPRDSIRYGQPPNRFLHRNVTSAGGIDTSLMQPSDGNVEVCATVFDRSNERVFAVTRQVGSGRIAWIRGSFSGFITNEYLPQHDDPSKLFQAEYLMRSMLAKFGYELRVEKPTIETRNPLVLVARSNNGFFFSGYCPSTAVTLRLRFPHGAPILHGYETWLEDGHSAYSMPRAWHRECRCFVEQSEAGEVSCVETTSEEVGIRRRFRMKGLKNATVHFYPEVRPAGPPVRMENNDKRISYTAEHSGRRLVARDVTGELLISW